MYRGILSRDYHEATFIIHPCKKKSSSQFESFVIEGVAKHHWAQVLSNPNVPMGIMFNSSPNPTPPHRLEFLTSLCTAYPKKYAHGFVVLCFVVVMQSFIMNSHEVFIHIHQGCFAGTGAIVRLPQCQWSKPDGYGKISQCLTTTKHTKQKLCAYFLGYTVGQYVCRVL